MTTNYDVFIGFAPADHAYARSIAHGLRRQGLDVYLDRKEKQAPSTSPEWMLDQTGLVLVIWSQHSVHDERVIEIAQLASEKGVELALSRDTFVPAEEIFDSPYGIINFKDWRQGRFRERRFYVLLNAILERLDRPTLEMPVSRKPPFLGLLLLTLLLLATGVAVWRAADIRDFFRERFPDKQTEEVADPTPGVETGFPEDSTSTKMSNDSLSPRPSTDQLDMNTKPVGTPLSRLQGAGLELVQIPGGSFEISQSQPEFHDEPVKHQVVISAFQLSKHEITNAQFCVFLNEKARSSRKVNDWIDLDSEYCQIERINGRYRPIRGVAKFPVVAVTWHGAREFCRWAGGRLPTEFEWEYAARGGEDYEYAGSNDPDTVAWHKLNSQGNAKPVGLKLENAYGLNDMSGNVWEYCENFWMNYRNENTTLGGAAVITIDTSRRVIRGGSWNLLPSMSRVKFRMWDDSRFEIPIIGFRLAYSSTEEPANPL